MFEYNNETYTLEDLQIGAEKQGLDFETYLDEMKKLGMVEQPKVEQEDISLEQPKVEDIARSAGMGAFYESALPSSIKKGMTIINVIKALPEIATDSEERAELGRFLKNRLDNVPEAFQSAYYSSVAAGADLFTADLDNLGYNEKQEEYREKAEKVIVEQYKNLNKLEFKDTGVGIVAGAKEGDAASLIAGVFGAGVSMAETAIPAALTFGVSLPIQVAAPMYTDYNTAKAKAIYGDDPNAIEKLVENDQTEIAIPLALGAVATGLEYIGWKGVDDYIRAMPGKGTQLAKLLWTGNKEGFTEIGQLGAEVLNRELGGGKTVKEASAIAWDSITSDEGLEMYLNGFLGAGQMSIAGRTLNRALRNDNASVKELNSKINNLADLNNKKYNTRNQEVKDAIDLEIKEAEKDLKNYVTEKRKISEILNEDQKQSLINTINEKDNVKSKIESLKKQLEEGSISTKEFGYAIRGLNNQDKRLSEEIELVNATAKEQLLQTGLETTKEEAEKLGVKQQEFETKEEYAALFGKEGSEGYNEALEADGHISEDGTTFFVNREIAAQEGAIGVGSHELLHAIIGKSYSKLKPEAKRKLNTEFLNLLGSKEKQAILTRLAGSYGITGDAVFETEELFTAFSDEIVDGGLPFSEGVFGKIKNTVHKALNALGYKKEFENARQTYNFLKDYSKNIKKGILPERAKEFAKVDPGRDEEAFSKTASDNVQRIYEEQGEAGAMDIIEQFKPITSRIAERRREAPNFDKELLMSEIEIGERGILDLIKEYKPESGVPLAAYINKFLPARAIEASKRVLGEEFTEDITERVDIAAEEVVTETETKPKPKKIVLAERLGVTDKVAKAVKKILPDLDVSGLTIKTLKNQVPDIIGDLFGISPKKIKSGANITKGELQSAQMFINKNADLLIAMLPEGATPSGTATGVPKVLLNEFYTKTDRAKMAKTGTKAGLAIQQKNKINKTDFLEVFGIIEGKPVRTDRNTSARVLALASQLGKMITNQAVRQELAKKPDTKKITTKIAEGKSKMMFSISSKIVENDVLNEGVVEQEFEMDDITHIDKLLDINGQKGIFRHRTEDEINDWFDAFENKIIAKMPESVLPKSRLNTILRPSRRIFAGKRFGLEGKGKDKIIIKKGKHKGKEMTIDSYYNIKRKELLAKDLKYGPPFKGEGAKYVYGKTYGDLFGKTENRIKKSFKNGTVDAQNKIHLSMHKQMWERINKSIKDTEGESLRVWGSWLSMVGQDTEHPHRMGAELLGYSKNPKGVKNKKGEVKLYEWEHAMPATRAYLYLLHNAADKNLDFATSYGLVSNNFKLIALDAAEDLKLKAAGRTTSMGVGWSIITDSWLDRYFKGDIDIDPMSIIGFNNKPFKDIYSIIKLKPGVNKIKTLNTAITKARTTKFSKTTKGMSAWDMDDTLARTKSGVIYTVPNPSMTPQPKRKVIFMAGGPGSGKSSVIKGLGLKEQGFKIVNQDISLEWLMKNNGLPTDMKDFTPEQASKFGSLSWDARMIAKRKQTKFQGQGDGIIVDGTGNSLKTMQDQVQEFKNKGYDVQMIFVETSLETALERNRARKERSLRDGIVKRTHESVQSNKQSFKEMFAGNFTEIKTDNLKQNDPMPARAIKQMDKFTKSYIKGRLDAGEFAAQGADILAQGGEFDFSEFDIIKEGTEGPLFGKAMDRAKKFGTKDQFIITARPHAAKIPIFRFLQARGLNIPIENIVTLENSTSEAKALWIAGKVGEGYNDIYFADDHLENVQAVDNVLKQFDVKGKVQQAKIKFSKSMNDRFNDILEEVTGIESKKRFSDIKARKRGESKGKFRFFIPPSHEDFVGLLYNFMGKGKKGNAHRDFFEQALVRPLNRAYREIDTARQAIANDYKSLNKQFPDVKKKLTKKTPDGDFTFQDAIRVYLWNKHDHKVPGLSPTDQNSLSELVMNDAELRSYAETLNIISKQETYINPTEGWEGGNIRIDLMDATGRVGRAQYLSEFNESADIIFSKENLNKIEAAYGASFKSALEDILHRIKTGVNRPKGQSGAVNKFINYLNGSVGSVMFFNTRSAILQQMSNVNYLNFADNNILAAAKAFANQPQYWKDFAFIFNSDMLKQRRGGIGTDINGAELAEAVSRSTNPIGAVIGKLLKLGFLPTQIGDNIAIATGGATFYRNRVNKYIKDGLNKKEAETAAFTDFQNITQATQQSARPDMTSQQQAAWVGKLVLNFLNTPSQYNRIIKKAGSDIKNRRITPPNTTQMQSDMSNASRILYYGAAQNLIFYSLQTALFAVMFGLDDEDEEKKAEQFLKKKERVINGAIDTILRGSGIYGVAVSTLKNMMIKFLEQREKGYNKDESAVIMEMLNFSPVVGIKARKIVNAEKTLNYNKKVIDEMETFDIDNPQWSAVTNYVEATTNAPVNRLYQKSINLRNAMDNDYTAFQRALFFSGYTTWSLNLGDTEKMKDIKEKVKGKKKAKKKKKKKSSYIYIPVD